MAGFEQPLLTHIYTATNYTGPFPVYDNCFEGERLSGDGSKPVVRVTPELVVKYGALVQENEAKSLLLIEEKAPSIPAPRVHALYKVGPYNRDEDDYGNLYDTYIVMTYIEGERLDRAWNQFDEAGKADLAAQLASHLQEPRSITTPFRQMFCSADGGPLLDPIFETNTTQGPFADEQELNTALISVHERLLAKAHLRYLIEGALAQNKHKAILTHGDFQGRNIMVADGKLKAIIDWEFCGWYPEYWEFVRCFRVPGWAKEWPSLISQILDPYYSAWAIMDIINRHIY